MPEDAQLELKIRDAIEKHATDCWVAGKVQEMNGHIDEIHQSQIKMEVHVDTISTDIKDMKGGFSSLTKALVGAALSIIVGLAVGIVIFLIKGG